MKAKKSLGQNFLKSKIALRKIVEAGKVKKGDIVLEIGPGKGALTSELLARGARVIAVEKDRELIGVLEDKFASEIKSRSLALVHDDILEFSPEEAVLVFTNGLAGGGTRRTEDLSKNSKLPLSAKRESLRYKLIANIPYNITGAVFKKFLSGASQPELLVLMVQHEVAKRIMSDRGSLLSVSVRAYGHPRIVMKIGARYFSPAPEVDSAVILVENISRDFFQKNDISEEKFWQVVRAGFAHKRKKLSSNLKNFFHGKNTHISTLGNKRAEEMSLSDWVILTQEASGLEK